LTVALFHSPTNRSAVYHVLFLSADRGHITSAPKDGIYVSGLLIEGATWNFPASFLEESRPMELVSPMPIIHFKPVEGKRKAMKGYYNCPLYMYPIRSGTRERPSFVVAVDLRVGKFTADDWTKRGVALLLSTAS
jgi:dynein heavy chain